MENIESLISKKTYSDFIKLAAYQIIGGTLGIIVIVWGLYEATDLAAGTVFIYLFMSLFFVYSFFCGIRCIQAKYNALRLSLINQYLQLIGFSIFGFAFQYIAGLYLRIQVDLTEGLYFGFGLGISQFDFKFNTESNTLSISLNIISMVLIILIDKLKKQVTREIEIRKTSEIGVELTEN